MKFMLVIVAAVTLLCSCTSPSVLPSNHGPWHNDVGFIGCTAVRNATDTVTSITLRTFSSTKGPLKKQLLQFEGDSYLVIRIYQDTTLVTTLRDIHPLCSQFEYAEHDDTNSAIGRGHIDEIQKDFSIRLPLDGDNLRVVIDEVFHSIPHPAVLSFTL